MPNLLSIKKWDPMDPRSYRSLFMLQTEDKLLCKILKKRMDEMTVMKLERYQFGFTKGRSTLQAIWLLRNLEKTEREERKDLYMVFSDLVKAFDSVDRGALMKTLLQEWIKNPLGSLIWNIYSGAEGVIEQKYKFPLERGVRQGSAHDPNLFYLIFVKICRSSLTNEKEVLGHFAYADELVPLASSQPELKEKQFLLKKKQIIRNGNLYSKNKCYDSEF